jgi:hypothetical protein
MRSLTAFLGAMALLLASAAHAQFVKGNEAVVGGKVETPPVPPSMFKVCGLKPVATRDLGAWSRPRTAWSSALSPRAPRSCRQSTYGSRSSARLGRQEGVDWFQCQYPDIASKCAEMSARPPPISQPTPFSSGQPCSPG